MVIIQAIPIWSPSKGETVQATRMSAKSIFDDLKSSAWFHYYLYEFIPGDEQEGTSDRYELLAEGDVEISGDDYQQWGYTGDTNKEAYQFVADKKKIIITSF